MPESQKPIIIFASCEKHNTPRLRSSATMQQSQTLTTQTTAPKNEERTDSNAHNKGVQ